MTSKLDGGAAVVGAVSVLQGSHQLGGIELPVNPDQQMAWIDEIPQPSGGNLEQRGFSPVQVQWPQHSSAPPQPIYPSF